MINPTQITNYNRTEAELEEFLLFCIVVAGKNAHQQAIKLNTLLNLLGGSGTPFEKINGAGDDLVRFLEQVRLGQYRRIAHAFRMVAMIADLKSVSIAELESISGIGHKTARFFVMHSRPDQQVATLDTHILKWLGNQGVTVPKSTPKGAMYYRLEQVFLEFCRVLNRTPAELDLEIWKFFAVGV